MSIGYNDTGFLGVVVNPANASPVFVHRPEGEQVEICIYRPNGEAIGYGELDDGVGLGTKYLGSVEITGYPRCHTAGGINRTYRGQGYGVSLYMGLVLFASARAKREIETHVFGPYNTGISSDHHRSHDAEKWWRAAVERGLATEDTGSGGVNEEVEDVDLLDRLSLTRTRKLRDFVNELLADAGASLHVSSFDRILVSGTEESEDAVNEAQYVNLQSAFDNNLVAVRQSFRGDSLAWAKSSSATPTGRDIDIDVILSLNVEDVNPLLVGKLAVCAHNAGANEADVTGMVMRERYGVDLLTHAIGKRSVDDFRFGRTPDSNIGVLVGNPRKRRNPPPTGRDEIALGKALERLARRREKLGLERFADLGDPA